MPQMLLNRGVSINMAHILTALTSLMIATYAQMTNNCAGMSLDSETELMGKCALRTYFILSDIYWHKSQDLGPLYAQQSQILRDAG